MTLSWLLWILLAYFSGSVSYALLLGKIKGVDIRLHGSGNVGATNLGRIAGKNWGFLCFLLDMLKGLLVVLACGQFYGLLGTTDVVANVALEMQEDNLQGSLQGWLWMSVAGAAVVGHVFPIWLRFKGGKGVATGFGVLLGIWPVLTIPAIGTGIVWLLCVKLFRMISLAGMMGACLLPMMVLATAWWRGQTLGQVLPYVIVTTCLAALVIARHRSNLKRIFQGTESKIGR